MIDMNTQWLTGSLNLAHPRFILIGRIESGLSYIMELHKSGAKCSNLLKKFSCSKCEENENLCKAIRKVEELELQYYKLTILEIVILYKEKIENEWNELPEWAKYQKKAKAVLPEQTKLFKF